MRSVLAHRAVLPLLRRCLPVTSVLKRRSALIAALESYDDCSQAHQGSVELLTREEFAAKLAQQLDFGQQRDAFLWQEFRALGGGDDMIDYDRVRLLFVFIFTITY